MAIDLDTMPATVGDITRLLTVLTIEIIANATLTSAAADATLEEIANRLQSLASNTTNERSKIVVGALAQSLMKTEYGSGI